MKPHFALFLCVALASCASHMEITYDTDLNVGQRVRHKKFGDGTVTAIQRFEKDAMVEIKFDSGETKRLMAVFAKLEKI